VLMVSACVHPLGVKQPGALQDYATSAAAASDKHPWMFRPPALRLDALIELRGSVPRDCDGTGATLADAGIGLGRRRSP
jgi:hypothetical protein